MGLVPRSPSGCIDPCVSLISEIWEIADCVQLMYAVREQDIAPFLRFLMETKHLSKMTTAMLFLVIFDGYEMFPAHGLADERRERGDAGKS